MAYFDEKQSQIIGKPKWETPYFVSNFWEYILGENRIPRSSGDIKNFKEIL